MKYNHSNLDKKLKKWFESEFDCAHLRRIEVKEGSIRGLTECSLSFDFPITAIAGKNGSGKSTALALACCAFHNKRDGYKAANRKHSYYTFADFFVQHKNEISPSGILIKNHIAHNKWKPTPDFPLGTGIGWQTRKKSKGGKWNEYASRVKRNVAFIGIERIVPHSEKSQSRSYNRYFKSDKPTGFEQKLAEIIGYILNKKYDEVQIAQHSKYRLPIAQSGGITFSGFNMGAGENALFEIFSTIYSCPAGSLIVIDEIELGLHIEAQKRFIKKLKVVCLERQIQVICTTHSSEIFECLPEEARIFIERINSKTIITTGSSSEYAFSRLSSENSRELTILVEDDVAKNLIALALPNEFRSRVHIEEIGSASALSIQLSSNFKLSSKGKAVAIFDGDQRSKLNDNITTAAKALELDKSVLKEWFTKRACFLPGTTWPENWILEKSVSSTQNLAELINTSEDSLLDIIEYGQGAGKHNEFYEIGKHINLSRHDTLYAFCINIVKSHSTELTPIIDFIREALSE
ncbi:hypothetical protein AUR61_006230 [Stutzerimonas balearica]|uniref:ATP-dependent nuclease n=1 Tax=Stutzerimonas balearica TaxID=74829 RepID=UPI000970A079|nr:AAA family ATPase [Stutzerimonas balearica]OMG65556.1 hypothetical protein AUR61_006230 [Stutzerimonas balearica]